MNIVIGVCGIGSGHCVRQSLVAEHLINNGHNVVLCSNNHGIRFFQAALPQAFRLEVWCPWIQSNKDGLDFTNIISSPINRTTDGYVRNFVVMKDVMSLFGGAPDLVITDYDPAVAQLAYATGAPLVTIDNHSIVFKYKFSEIDGFGPKEELARLGLLFPNANLRISMALFKQVREPVGIFPVSIIAPIVRQSILQLERRGESACDRPKIVVYLSCPYASLPQNEVEIVNIFKQFIQYEFIMFSANIVKKERDENITRCPFGTKSFSDSLAEATGVVCTAGFGLLSELLYLEIPAYVIPMPSFEQHHNAMSCSEMGIGIKNNLVSVKKLDEFLARLEEYRDKIHELKLAGVILDARSGLENLFDTIQGNLPFCERRG